MHYLELLRRLHEELRPAGYLEIGVDWGDSLQLSRARTVAIDPAPKPRPQSLLGKPGMVLYVGTSDDFFREHERETMLSDAPLDLAFVDGLHEFAQVARDLENVERWAHPETVVAIHDVLPRDAWEAAHAFHDGFWTGDVWRIVPFLRKHRPDLRLWLTEAEPTGMLMVTGFDPAHRGMSALAEAADAAFPTAGPDYDREVVVYIAASVPEPAETVLRTLGLERRLERAWEYQTKWGMRHVADASWRPLLNAAAALAHTEQHRDGLRACLRLINAYWLPEGVREEAYGSMAAYAESLVTLWPGAEVSALAAPGASSAAMRSPSPAAMDGDVVVAVATAAERGDSDWSLFDLGTDLTVQHVTPLGPASAAGTPAAIEQMHLVAHRGRLEALVTLCGHAQAGLATIHEGALRGLRFLGDAEPGQPGPPWVPFVADDALHAVSWWEPTEIQRIDPEAETARRVALHPAPRLAERFVGASAGVRVPGGWLFLVNETAGANGDGELTFARFALMTADFVVTAVSPHFWATARGQDAASGLTRFGEEVIAGFTSGGREASLARIPLAAVVASLLPVQSPALSVRREEKG